jgi:HlyD family secretion protein
MNDVNQIIHKKKWYKKKWPYVVLIIGLVLAGTVYGKIKKANQPTQYDTVKVVKGTLKQTVEATGNIESAADLDLRFETVGRVTRIYKKVGDSVQAGELLMDLDLAQLNAAVAQAQAGVAQAQANLDKQLAGNTNERISSLEASLAKTKADLAQVQGTVPGVENSKLVENAYDSMQAVLQSVQNTLASSLTAADNILGVDNTLANDTFEGSLSILDNAKLNTAKTAYAVAKLAKTSTDLEINALNNQTPHTQIDVAAVNAKKALENMKTVLFATAEVLDNTPPVGSLTQTNLDTLKTSIQTARTNLTTKYSSLVDAIHAIDTARNSYYSYQALVDKAQADLNDAKNPPREVDVAAYRAALQSTEASLAQAAAARDKGRIFAPMAGVIGKISPKVGEYVSAQDVVIKLVNPHFEVKVDIPETDIIKISLNDLATITLDAYGDEVKFAGAVTQIEKGQTVISDVVYYRVTVSLTDDKIHQILSGMTANVVFSTEQKDNVLIIPQRAVRTNNTKYVKVLENGLAKEVEVKTGLRGDEGLIEVLSGLSEGQEVIVGTKS